MTGKVDHLANNERYHLFTINGETYIMDIESPFWKVVFPFFFWLFPNRIFKVENKSVIEKLKTKKIKNKGSAYYTLFVGLSYTLWILLVSLMDYFNVFTSLWIHIVLLISAVLLVITLYLVLSYYRKRKLYNVLELDELPQSKLLFRPSSVGHFINVTFSYIFLFGASVFMFAGYIATENMILSMKEYGMTL